MMQSKAKGPAAGNVCCPVLACVVVQAMGQDCDLLGEVCGWINAKATKPVWAKMTPNITDITQPAAVAAEQGAWVAASRRTVCRHDTTAAAFQAAGVGSK
jgi:dihydroorotate dehydrogenase